MDYYQGLDSKIKVKLVVFFKAERDENILTWSGRQFHSSVAVGMKRREF